MKKIYSQQKTGGDVFYWSAGASLTDPTDILENSTQMSMYGGFEQVVRSDRALLAMMRRPALIMEMLSSRWMHTEEIDDCLSEKK